MSKTNGAHLTFWLIASGTPSHLAYNLRNREGADNYWIRIGSAWAHADGDGFNIHNRHIRKR